MRYLHCAFAATVSHRIFPLALKVTVFDSLSVRLWVHGVRVVVFLAESATPPPGMATRLKRPEPPMQNLVIPQTLAYHEIVLPIIRSVAVHMVNNRTRWKILTKTRFCH